MDIKARLKDFLITRQQAYQQTFNGVFAEKVLADLAKFCKANDTAFHPDARVHAVLEGRREVWLRLQKQLNLTQDQLLKLYKIEGE
ncbi:MAG: hypothetical protein IPI97_14565 [Nitrosomonas sp.]|nr:hypothetical protein [Nitrosomonas sp.]